MDYINEHDRPLGLYYFGQDKGEEHKVLTHTTSGGVTVNDVLMHITQEDLPFGGVGTQRHGLLSWPRRLQNLQSCQSYLYAVEDCIEIGSDPATALQEN